MSDLCFVCAVIKKHGGKQVDISEFHAQLDALGLKIIQVTADGNCFFRAFADQVEGNEEEHQSLTLVLHQILTVWKVNRIDGIYDSDCCDKDFEYVGSQKVDCGEHQIPTPTLGYIINYFELSIGKWLLCTTLHVTGLGKNNREMFEPFIEDDVSFDEYCQSMEKDGTWAGNMELQAASLVTRTNICIHRNMSPRWYIRNFDSHETRMVHLSYHDGEHYNSVRLKEDTSNGPARPIIIKADADLSAISCKAKAAVTKSKGGAGKNVIHADSIKLVMAGSGCEDAKKVEQILQQVGGDVDAANEFLIAEQATSDYLAESDKHSCPADTSHGIFENGNYEQQTEELKDNSCMSEQSCDKETTHDSESSHKDEKKIVRNKVCPCGSKKKYKACCGSVSGRSSKFTIVVFTASKQLITVRVGRKESKVRKVDLKMLQTRMGVKGRLMWVHCVFEHSMEVELPLPSEELYGFFFVIFSLFCGSMKFSNREEVSSRTARVSHSHLHQEKHELCQ
ncbi:hypothetical protein RHMOL_Rhmol08G0115100 [Rhododendron molle]|uniref:Uncharacterized protein n=1 Tax=Rhododendron molle TaxID=49168 RepID=A0ACC0MM43_RHOML|nr:hypothetical protein RHMOL_Rhmol08G0115100 [Rhododendron molle]